MPPIFHNRIGRFLLLLAAAQAVACGKNGRTPAPPESPPLAGRIGSPPLLSPVPVGSLDTVVEPAVGASLGNVLMRFYTEPGAKTLYAFHPFEATAPEAELHEFVGPTELFAPVAVWAVSDRGGQRGPVRAFSWSLAPEAHAASPAAIVRRLFGDGGTPEPFSIATAVASVAAPGTDEYLDFTVKIDGEPDEWPAAGRLRAADGLFDVAAGRGYLDLTGAAAGEDAEAFYAVLFLREAPRAGGATSYGFEIGPSGIDLGTFGGGAKLLFRAELGGGKARVTRLDMNVIVATGEGTAAALGSVVELRLAKADVPELAGATDLAVRVFAAENGTGYTVVDRMQTMFLRSRFDQVAATAGTDWADIRFLEPPGTADPTLAPSYLALGAALVKELEAANQIPFYERGTLPLFFVAKEENGYAGLNTSDRGMLTTLGASTAILTRAQLLAHELAHYQNARSSRVKSRWLQEGMSEWSAERLLYRHYPRRAVHRYLQRLRFDRYFDALDGKPDQFPLDTWGTEVERSGYEKSLMFFDLLEQVVGQAALIRAFQIGVNEPLDGAAFQRVLERETGKDLTSLFRYWVFPGDPTPEYDPYHVYKDDDGDELLGLDELALGTDPTLADTDGDGLTDAEEFYGGSDPLSSALDPAGELLGKPVSRLATTATDTSALLRIGGDPHATRTYGFDPYTAETPTAFHLPLFVRPPATVAVATTLAGVAGPVEILARPLFVNGREVPTPSPTTGILPAVPHKQSVIYDGVRAEAPAPGAIPYPSVTDPNQDVPAEAAAFDLTGLTVSLEDDEAVSLVLNTFKDSDDFGGYGEYSISLQTVDWKLSSEPGLRKWHGLTFVTGEPFWSSVDGAGKETAALLTNGIRWSFGKNLTVRLAKSLVADWLAAPGERQVCAQSLITLEGGATLRDKAGCIVLGAPGYTLRRATTPDAFGMGSHTLDLAVDTPHFNAARATELLALEASALREFEVLLTRPLLDRRQWPIHLTLTDGGNTSAAAAATYGGYVTIDKAAAGSTVDYLVVEQLARLATADLLDRLGDRAYWLQEAFIQWLTASALYRIYPSRAVHEFHAARIQDFKCFVDGAPECATYFTRDLPLAQWDASTLGSTGSVRALMAALELDALVGTEVMAKAFGLFANAAPDAAALRRSLAALAPGKAAELEAFWASRVEGSGDQTHDTAVARAEVGDADLDGLYLFEERRLGTSDAVADDYLAP